MAMELRSAGLQFRVACILLAEASHALKKANDPLYKDLDQFLQGVIKEQENGVC